MSRNVRASLDTVWNRCSDSSIHNFTQGFCFRKNADCVNHTKHINTLSRQSAGFSVLQNVVRRYHCFKWPIPNSIIRNAPDTTIMLSSHIFHTPVGHFHGGCLTFIHVLLLLQLFWSFNKACSISHILQFCLCNCERYTAKKMVM